MSEPLPADVQKKFLEGSWWLRDHLLNHAELRLGHALREMPGHPAILHHLGIAQVKLGRGELGLAKLRTAASADPDNAEIASDLALASAPDGQNAVYSVDHAEHDFRMMDYRYVSKIRHGSGKPPHPELTRIIEAGRVRYESVIDAIGAMRADFADVPIHDSFEKNNPFWVNGWFPPLDGMALTYFLRDSNPAHFIEIGSGVSTKFARRAVDLYGLRTSLTSIDPHPRNQIDTLCDTVIRQPLEDADPSLFDVLEPGDILFLDSSHRAFQGSDVTVFFLEILPRLKPGVIIQIHDVYLPDDYISGHVRRIWNEQYLLATLLLFGGSHFDILFPCWFAYRDPALSTRAKRLIRTAELEWLNLYGVSFWLAKR